MIFPRMACTSGAPILLCVLVLVWGTVGHSGDVLDTQHPKEDRTEGWNVSHFFWKTVEPLVTKARKSWTWIQTPGPVRGYLQTYYEDHLSGLGLRAQNWLHASREKALNLCPKRLCGNT